MLTLLHLSNGWIIATGCNRGGSITTSWMINAHSASKTDVQLRQSLEEYFDAGYVGDLGAIDSLLNAYEEATAAILAECAVSSILDSPYLKRNAFEKAVSALRLAIEANIQAIRRKRKEPSSLASLNSTVPLVTDMQAHINAANAKVRANNDTLRNLDAHKRLLSAQIWKRLLENSKAVYNSFKTASTNLNSAITNLEGQITTREGELDAKKEEIAENERKITSIKPTIDAINKLLKSFGFTNFYLVESTTSGFYEVNRHNGDDAKQTLSEGEKSFITFLYFYHLIKGSFTTSGAASDRIVVFDDPVSSLDSDILFIVCNLIKGVVNEMKTNSSSIKQIFVLTHNVYFHKEITFDKKSSGTHAGKDKTFWIIRKSEKSSELVSYADNPIKSSYELLWREIRHKPPSETTIQNDLRRILDHYFTFFGGIKLDDILAKFDGQEKMICGSLLSWINDGSHFANDDLFMSCDQGQISRYLNVFQRIFEESGHRGHYEMMMGDTYVPLPAPPMN
jgi:wobble nucleotide-excising tRNase